MPTPRDAARIIARDCLAVRIRLLNRMITRVYDDALRPHGLTTAQLNVMIVVALRQPVRPADVARTLELDKSTLSRNQRLLVERGLVGIEHEAGGGTRLALTRRGAALLPAAFDDWKRAQREAGRLLGTRGAAAVRRAADRALEKAHR